MVIDLLLYKELERICSYCQRRFWRYIEISDKGKKVGQFRSSVFKSVQEILKKLLLFLNLRYLRSKKQDQ
jgi:hypothetical protein